jgi:hypothetical protein
LAPLSCVESSSHGGAVPDVLGLAVEPGTCDAATESLMFEFSEAGRSFRALVYIDREASQQTKDQTFVILDRLHFRVR